MEKSFTSEKIKVGDTIEVVNEKSNFFGKSGIVTKVKNSQIKFLIYQGTVRLDHQDGDFTHGKVKISDVKKIENSDFLTLPNLFQSLIVPPVRPMITFEGKKIFILTFLQKLFPIELFDKLLLLHMVEDNSCEIRIGGHFLESGNGGGLDKILSKKSLKSTYEDPWIFFTPIPKKLFESYYLEEFSKGFDDFNFLILDGKVICSSNFSTPHILGVSFCGGNTGPVKFYYDNISEKGQRVVYIMNECKNSPELTGSFRDAFLKAMEIKIVRKYFTGDMNSLGVRREIELIDEGKFTEIILRMTYKCLTKTKGFLFHENWEKSIGVKLKFSEEDILMKHFSGNSAEEEIKSILKK